MARGRQWHEITTHSISHSQAKEKVDSSRQLLSSAIETSKLRWISKNAQELKAAASLRSSAYFFSFFFIALQGENVKNLREDTKDCNLLASEGVQGKTSRAAQTQKNECVPCVCVCFSGCGASHVCLPRVSRELQGGRETTYTSTCAAFLVETLQSQG